MSDECQHGEGTVHQTSAGKWHAEVHYGDRHAWGDFDTQAEAVEWMHASRQQIAGSDARAEEEEGE